MLVDFFHKLRKSGEGELKVVYFGDHLRNDVQISKTFMNWGTVAIVEEMEDAERELGFKLSNGYFYIKMCDFK